VTARTCRAAALAAALLAVDGGVLAADEEAGRTKAQACTACHGEGGNSANPGVPSIAGQPAQAISTQLFQFREGNRKDAQMSPMAANLSNSDINDLAAYFSGQKMAPPKHQTAPANAAAGVELTKKLNCTQCHGPALVGLQHIPRLAGQQADYLRAQLKGFKAGTRADMDGNMTAAARPLSDKDIDALVDYLAGLGAQSAATGGSR
jgi:cytochrome c553